MSTTALPRRKSGPKLTDTQRLGIAAHVATGIPQVEVAETFGVHRQTVGTIVRSVRAMMPDHWKDDQARLAIEALNAGLACPDDPYKRGSLGATALKGLGLHAADSQVINNVFVTAISSLPADWQARYASSEDPIDGSPIEDAPGETQAGG